MSFDSARTSAVAASATRGSWLTAIAGLGAFDVLIGIPVGGQDKPAVKEG
jgi:hypothetical protein